LSAQIDEQAHRTQAALATLQGVAIDDPLAPLAELRRAALLQRLGRPEEALAVLDRLATSVPDQPAPWIMRGAILRGEHRAAESVSAYGEAIARVKQPGRSDWSLFFERGIAEEQGGSWPAAEADFDRALALWPDQPSVLNYLGYSWTEQGRNLPRARQMIERAASLQPNDGAILDSLGWIMLRQGDVTGAVRNLERAVELEPEDATINGHLGDAYLAAKRKQEATFQWRRALTLNPDPDEKNRIATRLREAGVPPPVVGEQTTGKAPP
jgi:Flp pilus assembly protein TadD